MEPERRGILPLPPFILVWFGLFLIRIVTYYTPFLITNISIWFEKSTPNYISHGMVEPLAYFRAIAIMIPGLLLVVVPILILVASVISIVTPRRRCRITERDLHTLPPIPVIEEIRSYIHSIVPGMPLCGNLVRGDLLAFVYPSSPTSNRLALFGGLVKAWRSDPEGAHAILLHELAHDRNGDPLFIGSGSPLRLLLNRFLIVILASPFAYASLGNVLIFFLTDQASEVSLPVILNILYIEPFIYVISQIPGFIYLLVLMINIWFEFALPPLLAIWGMEFSADVAAANAQNDTAPLIRMLLAKKRRISIIRWLLERISHPPVALRVALLQLTSSSLIRSVIAILFFPVAYAFHIIIYGNYTMQLIWWRLTHPSESWSWILARGVDALVAPDLFYLVMVLFVIAWPLLLLLTGRVDRSVSSNQKRTWITAHVVAGVLIFLLQYLILCLILSGPSDVSLFTT